MKRKDQLEYSRRFSNRRPVDINQELDNWQGSLKTRSQVSTHRNGNNNQYDESPRREMPPVLKSEPPPHRKSRIHHRIETGEISTLERFKDILDWFIYWITWRGGIGALTLGSIALFLMFVYWVYLTFITIEEPRIFSADPTPVQLNELSLPLKVPYNMIRGIEKDPAGNVLRYDLHLHWPSLQGYTSQNAKGFLEQTLQIPVIRIFMLNPTDAHSPRTRFEKIYWQLSEESVAPANVQLKARKFKDSSPYTGDEIYYSPDSNQKNDNLYVLRCMSLVITENLAGNCLRELLVAKRLKVIYRMPLELLPQWREVDFAVKNVVAAIATESDIPVEAILGKLAQGDY